METITAGFLEKGVLGLVIGALIIALGILWKYLVSERNSSTARLQELQEQHAKEREALVNDSRQANTETLDRVYTLTRAVTKTTERVTAVVEENTRVIQQWGAKVDSLGGSVLVLSERVDRLEEKR